MGSEWTLRCYQRFVMETLSMSLIPKTTDLVSSNCGPQVENGYAIWDFRGQEQQRHLVDRFKQFLWRPRPRTLLDKEQQKAVRKNLREYSRTFDEEDAALESNVSAELIQARKRAVNE